MLRPCASPGIVLRSRAAVWGLDHRGLFSEFRDVQDRACKRLAHSSPASCNVQTYRAVSPPSIVRVVPVMKDDSSDARKATAAATSDTSPIRCRMSDLVISSHSSSRLLPTLAACASDASVSIGPGQRAFTLHVQCLSQHHAQHDTEICS